MARRPAKRKKRGRKPLPPAMRRTQSLKVYISNAERARLDEAAGFQPLSDWAREVLLAEAGK